MTAMNTLLSRTLFLIGFLIVAVWVIALGMAIFTLYTVSGLSVIGFVSLVILLMTYKIFDYLVILSKKISEQPETEE